MPNPSEPQPADFHDPRIARALCAGIARSAEKAGKPLRFMEVCGTHTLAVARHGLKDLLPPGVSLVSGPGCPVCVTADAFIDASIRCALEKNAVVATFGDMVRVPGKDMSLERARAEGADVRMVFSPMDALEGCAKDPAREWVFLGIGFETTTPLVAATLKKAKEKNVRNFSVLCAHKTVPPALHALLDDKAVALDGFLCPGHVSVITGPEAYEDIARRGAPCVVTGFEPLDILQGIGMLSAQASGSRSEVEVQYFRAVKPGGNPKARAVTDEVFRPCDARWRGLGVIRNSGLALRDAFAEFDAAVRFDVSTEGPDSETGCRCGDVLRGVIVPPDCPLFGKRCRPENPVGPCMVSSEGSCGAAYKFSGA